MVTTPDLFSKKPNDMSKGHPPQRRPLSLSLSPSLLAADSNIYVNVLRKRLAVSTSNP